VTQQVGNAGASPNPWRSIVNFVGPPYYPRMHVVSNGKVFMPGPLALTQFLDTSGAGMWTFLHPDPDDNKARPFTHMDDEYALEVREFLPS
jgi:hypothetical protein